MDVALAQVHARDNEFARISVRKRLEQDCVGDAEDRRAGADPESNRKDGDQSVTGATGKDARSNGDIFPCHGRPLR